MTLIFSMIRPIIPNLKVSPTYVAHLYVDYPIMKGTQRKGISE